jgi:hypothetical protein
MCVHVLRQSAWDAINPKVAGNKGGRSGAIPPELGRTTGGILVSIASPRANDFEPEFPF